MKVLVLGASGMLGSMVTDFLSRDPEMEVIATARDEKILEKGRALLPKVTWKKLDALSGNSEILSGAMNQVGWIVNAIGITKPLIRDDNPFEVERALRVNSLFPHELASAFKSRPTRVLQIATDCVYSGKKGNYLETDEHDPLDVYGKSKSLGEVNDSHFAHLRCSIIGPEPKEYKFLIEWFRRQPQGAPVNGFTNHQWNGVTTLHFAKVVGGIIKKNLELPRLVHVIPSGFLTKAQMLHEFARAYRRKDIVIRETPAEKIIDRTLSTRNPKLNLGIWQAAGYASPPTVPDMIAEMGEYPFRFEGRL